MIYHGNSLFDPTGVFLDVNFAKIPFDVAATVLALGCTRPD
jgi:hypothetical protein